jgi:hypothetical protein
MSLSREDLEKLAKFFEILMAIEEKKKDDV